MSMQPARVISFTSGKGGVGKTSIVANVGVSLAREGRKVLLFDADFGLANLDVILGLRPLGTIADVLAGTRSIEEIMVEGPDGLMVIPAASGIESLADLSVMQRTHLRQAVEEIAYEFDYLLIDTASGIGSSVLYFTSAAQEIVCVVNAEPTSLTDAYAMMKVLAGSYGERAFSIVVNGVRDENQALRTFRCVQASVDRFLHVSLRYLGWIPHDGAVAEAVRAQRAVVEIFPSSPSGLAFARLAHRIADDPEAVRIKGGVQFFFEHLLRQSM